MFSNLCAQIPEFEVSNSVLIRFSLFWTPHAYTIRILKLKLKIRWRFGACAHFKFRNLKIEVEVEVEDSVHVYISNFEIWISLTYFLNSGIWDPHAYTQKNSFELSSQTDFENGSICINFPNLWVGQLQFRNFFWGLCYGDSA